MNANSLRLDRLSERTALESVESLYIYEVQCLGWSDHKYKSTYEPVKCGICGCPKVQVQKVG